MEKILNNFKLLYIDILKRTEQYLKEAHLSDLKFNKSNVKNISLKKMINQINKISLVDLDDISFNKDVNFILLPTNFDFHFFPKLLLINIINKNNVVFVKRNKKDNFILQMIVSISNSFASEFNNKRKSFLLHTKILKGRCYDAKITQLKTKQHIVLAKNSKSVYFK